MSFAARWHGWESPSSWRVPAKIASHMLDRIQKEADRINELVAELLQVTRVEGDPTTLRSETVRLDELLADLVYDSLLEAKAKDCTLLLEGARLGYLERRRRADPPRYRERDPQRHPLRAARDRR